jgi:flagellar basal body P-ring protein FlgI
MQELKSVTMSNDQIMQELKQSREELKNATMSNNQAMQELKTASISDNENIQNLAKIEGHIDYLVAEFNRMGRRASKSVDG